MPSFRCSTPACTTRWKLAWRSALLALQISVVLPRCSGLPGPPLLRLHSHQSFAQNERRLLQSQESPRYSFRLRASCRGGKGEFSTATQICGGAALIFSAERAVWAFGEHVVQCKIPVAPTGMMLVFLGLITAHAVAPQSADRVADWFEPAVDQLLGLVPLFFAPPLVQLPIALAPLAGSVILKMMAVIISGSVVGVLSTGVCVQLIWGAGGRDIEPSSSVSSSHSPATRSSLPYSVGAVAVTLLGLLLSVGVYSQRLSIDAALTLLLSGAAMQAGLRLPARCRRFLPAAVSSALFTSAGIQLLALWQGRSPHHALRAYRTGTGGLWGGSGAGDWLFLGAPSVVVALGFRLYTQRRLLARRLVPLAAGSMLNCVLSVAFSAAASRLLRVPSAVGRSLLPRFTSLPIAVPLASALHASPALASLATSLQGIVAASAAFPLLDAAGVRDPLARGLAIGGSAHALGTATAAAAERESAAPAAIGFMLSGAFMAPFFFAPLANALQSLF